MARVDDVKSHPLFHCEVAHAWMLREQIGATLGQQRAVDLVPGFDASQEMRLGLGAADRLGGHSAFGRLASRWKPAQSKDEESGDLLCWRPAPAMPTSRAPCSTSCLPRSPTRSTRSRSSA